jgi:hypothetical protein
MSGAPSPDLEALVTPRIRDAFQAAIGQIGKTQFLSLVGLNDHSLAVILSQDEDYVPVGLVTVVCQINKTHDDPDPAHSSLTECLKGTTIRIPPSGGQPTPSIVARSRGRRRLVKANQVSTSTGPLIDKRGMRLLGFAANTISFFILGYFLGGVAMSPLIGQASCIGVSTSPPSLAPCEGSFIGLVISAIGGLGYTYYYFVKKL